MKVLLLLTLVGVTVSQLVGDLKKNEPLPLEIQECTGSMSCTPVKTKVTMDQNWRWVHKVGQSSNCYTGNLWDDSVCPDPQTCTQNCCIDGIDNVDWAGTYGVSSTGKEVSIQFVTNGPYSTNIGSRMYLLDPSENEYYMFKLKNKELTMDVDVSMLPCGLNGAVYLVEMDKDGGASKHPTNKGGAAYGTGYCDAQCPHDIKFINGEANSGDWIPSDNDANAGVGHYGSCCVELDIWEANSISTAFTLHPCDTTGPVRCEGKDCGDNASGERYDGLCDKDGCDFHSWRMGDQTFFGPGSNFKVDTTKPMTVVTQFITNDGTDTGDLVEMRRLYVQNGVLIANSFSNVPGVDKTDSVNEKMCEQSKNAFGDPLAFQEKGGMKAFGDSMENGMVLVLSLWDDHEAGMLWLDSNFPADADPSKPGVSRGSCSTDSGNPADLEANYPKATVKISNLKVGTLGSTFFGGEPVTTTTGGSGGDCPGGDLDHCLSLCPDSPATIHDGCVQECNNLC
ncbi:probable 1,4-beta-D-glucan cellobiohydrolase A [Eurytemora carolleeae]|uniref:probable 1,4-beta-D-glucan cellobiohydrolase A n=1 Tax=Eurytemora carolleeae TaxID=1294199 RepID=UPI000C772521|nr:probable 1,4-beta-D-glucan cellobiohydrolase A [Eurytemora carolleeae]|eukprot:XP_023342726.1 probable 1,4-beta-D-glucan cellobiohydrolase A [Eurytemora affinis]